MDEKVYKAFGYDLIIYKDDRVSFPLWRFKIYDPKENSIRFFIGLPNTCFTVNSAYRRAWWRAKWLAEGTYGEKYK